MPRTSGADLWSDPSKQHETQRGMVARGRLMPKTRRTGKQRKTKTDESQVAVLEIASRGSWEGCRLCWVQGVQLGEMRCGQTNEGGELRRESWAGSWELENRGVSGKRDLRSWEGTGNPGRKHGTRQGERKMIRKTNK